MRLRREFRSSDGDEEGGGQHGERFGFDAARTGSFGFDAHAGERFGFDAARTGSFGFDAHANDTEQRGALHVGHDAGHTGRDAPHEESH
jgi:hypothetical protein